MLNTPSSSTPILRLKTNSPSYSTTELGMPGPEERHRIKIHLSALIDNADAHLYVPDYRKTPQFSRSQREMPRFLARHPAPRLKIPTTLADSSNFHPFLPLNPLHPIQPRHESAPGNQISYQLTDCLTGCTWSLNSPLPAPSGRLESASSK